MQTTIFNPAFDLALPDAVTSPLVLNSPHSGRVYPDVFLAQSKLDPMTLRRSEDAFVDDLFLDCVSLGIPLMRAHFPRAWLDVNREPFELDPRMFDGRLPAFANIRSLRVAGGLGTIPRIVGEAQEIYARRLPVEEASSRIEDVYKPYHRALRGLTSQAFKVFGMSVLIDCHSMPSSAFAGRQGDKFKSDFVLGDRYGASAAPQLVEAAERVLRQCGYEVQRNRPYAGGFITESYGNPIAHNHALQIEIRRDLYMDERLLQPSARFAGLAADLRRMIGAIAETAAGMIGPERLAAE